jgi:hypothetical protein
LGQALQFDEVDDHVTIDGTGSLENVTDGGHTFSAWVKPDSVPPGTTANDTAYSVLVREYTGLYYDDTQKFRAEIQRADGTRVSVSSNVFAPGIWHHLVMAVDDTTKKLHLYVDGQEVNDSPVSYSGSLADHQTTPYYIGTSEPLTNYYEYRFKGMIDEAAIFKQALSKTEVQALFAGFSNVFVPVTAATVQVSATPTTIGANQGLTTTLTAVANDATQSLLPAGRVVQFTTNKGVLANQGLTIINNDQGRATIVLTAAGTSGLAEITATIDSITASTTVQMLGPKPMIFLPFILEQ